MEWYEACQCWLMVWTASLLLVVFLFTVLLWSRFRLSRSASEAFYLWLKAPVIAKLIVPFCLCVSVVVGGGKNDGRARSVEVVHDDIDQFVVVDCLSGYKPPLWVELTDNDVFVRPEDSFTPARWQGLGVCDDRQLVGHEIVADVCGVASRFDATRPDLLSVQDEIYAPFPGTLSLLPGVSDFWSVTNGVFTRLVWKNAAVDRDPANLVSFAVQVYDWGDVAYVYQGNSFSNSVSPYVQLGSERLYLYKTNNTETVAYLAIEEGDSTSWSSKFPDFFNLSLDGEYVACYDTNEYFIVSATLSSSDIRARDVNEEIDVGMALNKKGATVVIYEGKKFYRGHKIEAVNSDITNIVLRTGKRYKFAVYSNRDRYCITDITVPEGVQKRKLKDGDWLAWRQIVMQIEHNNSPSSRAGLFRASLSPNVPGGEYKWTATGPFSIVSPSRPGTEVFRNGPGDGSLTCVWSKNGIAATNTITLAETDMTQGGDYLGLSLDHPVVLKEETHLDVEGTVVSASTQTSQLAMTYEGTTPGVIDISANNPDVRVYEDGRLRELPISIPVSGPASRYLPLDLSLVSEEGNEITFDATLTTNDGRDSFSQQATLRIAKLTVEADEPWPDERRRHVFGPCEAATARIEPASLAPTWRDGSRQAGGSSFALPAPNAAVEKNISVEIAGTSIDIPLRYIAPASCVATAAYAMTDDDWRQHTIYDPPGVNELGAGLKTDLKLMPDVVSFAGLHIQEGYSPASGAWGYYEPYGSQLGGHGEREGAGRDVTVTEGNVVGTDYAGHAQNSIPPGLSLGGYEFRIPMYWSVNATQGTCFVTNVQKYVVYPNADFKVTKFGYSVLRHANGVYETPQEEHE